MGNARKVDEGKYYPALALEIGDMCMEAIEIDEDDIIWSKEVALPEKERKIATEIRRVLEGVGSDDED